MYTSNEQVEGKRRECGEHGLHERFTPPAMLFSGPVHSVKQLGGGDRRDANGLVLAELRLQALGEACRGTLRGQTAHRPLELDEDGGV